MKKSSERSAFAQRFEKVYGDTPLPPVYREFILSDAYLPYIKATIRGLTYYGPEDVEIELANPLVLDRAELWDASDIDAEDAEEYHPIAMIGNGSSQFLAIDKTQESAPVFLWHHETGTFHPQFASLSKFLQKLKPHTTRSSKGNG